MTHEQILDLIWEGEGSRLDFKLRVHRSERFSRVIASFANNNGGILLIGVDDFGIIQGCDEEREIGLLKDAAGYFCDPPVEIDVTSSTEMGKTVLVVRIAESTNKPHMIVRKDGTRKAYIRVDDKSMPVGRKMEQVLRNEDFLQSDRKLDSKEQLLLDYLSENERVTAAEYRRLINIGERRARRILYKMMQEGWINFHEDSKSGFYTLGRL